MAIERLPNESDFDFAQRSRAEYLETNQYYIMPALDQEIGTAHYVPIMSIVGYLDESTFGCFDNYNDALEALVNEFELDAETVYALYTGNPVHIHNNNSNYRTEQETTLAYVDIITCYCSNEFECELCASY